EAVGSRWRGEVSMTAVYSVLLAAPLSGCGLLLQPANSADRSSAPSRRRLPDRCKLNRGMCPLLLPSRVRGSSHGPKKHEPPLSTGLWPGQREAAGHDTAM